MILPDTNLLLYAFRPEFPNHGFTLASHDQDFRRFTPELDWLDPLARQD